VLSTHGSRLMLIEYFLLVVNSELKDVTEGNALHFRNMHMCICTHYMPLYTGIR